MSDYQTGNNPFKACEQTRDQGFGGDAPQKKGDKKKAGIFCGILGVILILAGIIVVFTAGFTTQEEEEEPVDVYQAREKDQYVFAPVQYMTEAVAYYEALDQIQIYIAMDEEWNPAVICLHNEERQLIQPYIDYLYSDGTGSAPEVLELKGYAQPFNSELRQMVIEGFADAFGEGYVDESNFQDWFGGYYVQAGQKSSAYGVSRVGFYLCIAGIAAVVICGGMLYKKPLTAKERKEFEEQGGLVVVKSSKMLGILGAFLGAFLGGFLWTVVMAWGYVSGWLGMLIIVFAHTGYVIGSGREDIFGKVVSFLMGILIVIPATFLSFGWEYYQMVNESVSGYMSFGRVLVLLPHFMNHFGLWKDFIVNLVQGYGYMTIAAAYYIASFFFNIDFDKKKVQETTRKELNLRQINESVGRNTETEDEQNLK